MKFTLTCNGRETTVDLLDPAPVCRFRMDDDPERIAHVETPEPGVYSVILEGRPYDARLEETPSGLIVVIDGYRFEIEVRDPRRRASKSARARAEGVQSIAAPMPGKVVRVLVAAGDEVQGGQGILVVEAMKMQNEMQAARPGRVLTVSVREGATVVAGEVLATIG